MQSIHFVELRCVQSSFTYLKSLTTDNSKISFIFLYKLVLVHPVLFLFQEYIYNLQSLLSVLL